MRLGIAGQADRVLNKHHTLCLTRDAYNVIRHHPAILVLSGLVAFVDPSLEAEC